jgi:hypothetical protein
MRAGDTVRPECPQAKPIDWSIPALLRDVMLAAEEHFFLLLIKPFLIGVFAGLAFNLVNRRFNEEKLSKLTDILVVVPIVLIAYIAGYLTGISGSAAVGNLIPAVLAFIGGLNVYLFGATSEYKTLSIYSIFLFAITLFYGVLDGGYEREGGREAQMQEFAARELRIRNYRQNLSLPPDPPSWATTDP